MPGASLGAKVDLSGIKYSVVVAAFFVPYVVMEAPSNFFLKYFSPSKWIARIMLSWGIVTACQAAVTSYGGLIACRVFLGLAEAGFYPGCIFYLTFFYKAEERAQRMAIFAGSVAVSGAFSGLLATAISFLNGRGGLFGWQWLFILEALPAIIMSVFIYFWMPDYPQTARFLTEEEREMTIARLSRHAPTLHDKTLDMAAVKTLLLNVDFWLFALAYFCMTNSLNAVGFFLPTLVSSLGFRGWRGQAMTVPPNVFACIVIVANAAWSDRRRERCSHALGALALVGVGYILLAATSTVGPRLVGVFLIACTNAAVIPFLAFRLSTVSGSSSTALASGVTIAVANIGGITAPFIFAGNDAPEYRTGNWVVFGMQILAAAIIGLLWFRLGSSALYSVRRGDRGVDEERVADADNDAVSDRADKAHV